jgi:hypothetical protein
VIGGAIESLVKYRYVVVFVSVLAEQIGLPVHSAPVLMAAGTLAGFRRLNVFAAPLTMANKRFDQAKSTVLNSPSSRVRGRMADHPNAIRKGKLFSICLSRALRSSTAEKCRCD